MPDRSVEVSGDGRGIGYGGGMEPVPDYDLPAELDYAVRPVGVMRSPFQFHHGTPRQPRVGTEQPGAIVIRQGLQNLLKDLAGFSHIWVVFWANYARGWNDLVVPPRDDQKRGLFATRAPHRPNPIGISAVELRRVERRVLHVGAHDILNGSPILDVKPYLPYSDAIADARVGWVEGLTGSERPDHRDWQAEVPERTSPDA